MHQSLENQHIGPGSATADLLRTRPEEKKAEGAAGQQVVGAEGPRKWHPTRAGTRSEPYERKKDGVKTVKVAFSGSKAFVERLRRYTSSLPPEMPRNTWMELVLENAMARNAGLEPPKAGR